MSVLEGSNEAMRFDMASLDAESARQAREELLARLQRISDQVDGRGGGGGSGPTPARSSDRCWVSLVWGMSSPGIRPKVGADLGDVPFVQRRPRSRLWRSPSRVVSGQDRLHGQSRKNGRPEP